MQITHTITVLELVWTIVATVGLLFNTLLVWRAFGDRNWLIYYKANGDHDLRTYVALTSILIFAGGVSTQFSYFTIGCVALTQPSPGGHVHVPQIVSSIIFIAASIVGTVLAGLIYSRRMKVIRLVAEKLEEH